ncbi:hypothetical protein QCA50_019515 [Cerrena zonata]|uniref:Peptidase A1 domain-containing protein n=1 Tax=Cerrena zonata TaxID=2478898 RepID=A0AAW0FF52_9APHY
MLSSIFATLLCVQAILVSALQLPISRRNVPRSISRRDSVSHGVLDPSDPFNFQNVNGLLYTTTIHINGRPFEVQVDTGSSDLWLDTAGADMTGSNNTGIPASISYEDQTTASGNLTTIDITWGNYTIKDQLFINAPGSNATGGLTNGLIGLGPVVQSQSALAVVYHNATATISFGTPTDNIFEMNPNLPTYVTFILSRVDHGAIDGGEFTIGEIVQGYESILTTPKLPVYYQTGRWVSTVDGININGERIEGTSLGSGGLFPSALPIPDGQFTAVFDTGNSGTVLPRPFVNAIFSNVLIFRLQGQEYMQCDFKANVSIIIGGLEYPIHPLDLLRPSVVADDGTVWCIPQIDPIDTNDYGDFQFGDVVLRNLYTLFNYGNWTRPGDTQPYIQILSLTDKEKAWAEFDAMQEARAEQFYALNLNSTSSNDTETSSGDSSTTVSPSGFSQSTNTQSSNTLTSSAVSSPKDLAAAGALSHADDDTIVDLSGLIRNSYVIIALLVVALLLLIGVLLLAFLKKLAPRSNNQRYKEVVPAGSEFETLSGPSGRYSD